MKHTTRIRRRSTELKELEASLKNSSEGSREKTCQAAGKLNKVNDITETILGKLSGTFRSSWAKGIQVVTNIICQSDTVY